jgi:putative OPT family oligopeptide transporter
MKPNNSSSLPENSFRELREGETYTPVMLPNTTYPEVTAWSVIWGIIMAILFSAATAYSGLKVGQVMEAGIPIAILAVGVSTFRRGHTLGQNVIIQSIGAAAGGVVGGAIFVLPALYILDLAPKFYQMFLATLFGGILGILFLIPFRKYFVKDMHGKLPFPEATAATEILITGEKGGSKALVLVMSAIIGGVYDFIAITLNWWSDTITSRMVSAGETLATKFKLVFKMNTLAMIFGIGYIIGLKYTAVICAGSFLSWFVLIPLFNHIGYDLTVPLGTTASKVIAAMSAEEIFSSYVKHIGIGAIAMAGVVGLLRSSKVIKGAIVLAFNEIFRRKQQSVKDVRWQTDIKMPFVVLLILLTAIAIFVFLISGVVFTLGHAITALVVILLIAFLFATVAANAIAIVGNNPVSGMTLMTLILSSLVLNYVGLTGTTGMISAIIIGGVVASALAMSGTFITDLKIGYWIGSTPRNQERFKFLGTLVASATTVLVVYILNQAYGFKGPHALVAPQANAMAAVIQPLMSNVAVPWMLYFVGAVIALLATMLKVPPLPLALGMYLPQDLNTPLLAGGLISWWIASRSKDEKINAARNSRGTLIASGFIAGGSLFGVVGAILKFSGIDWSHPVWQQTHTAEGIALFMFVLLVGYLFWEAMRAKGDIKS